MSRRRGLAVAAGIAIACVGVVLAGHVLLMGFGFQLVLGGLVLAVSLVIERVCYKELQTDVPAGWQDTGERTIQDGDRVAVYFQPGTGARRYVRLGEGIAAA